MDILIDIGNTNLKWCLLEHGGLGALTAIPRTNIETLRIAWITLPSPDRILVGSVATVDVEQKLTAIAFDLWGLVPQFLRPQQQVRGLNLAYADPGCLGVDRWLAMLAARHQSEEPMIVVDCGTAITLDAIDAAGNHLGGLILPGLHMLWNGLFAGTQVKQVEFPATLNQLGQNTGECVAAGAIQAVTGMIERIYAKLSSSETTLHLLLTGGDANLIATELRCPYVIIPELIFAGMALLVD
jgi:type III pantothenate kinase